MIYRFHNSRSRHDIYSSVEIMINVVSPYYRPYIVKIISRSWSFLWSHACEFVPNDMNGYTSINQTIDFFFT